MNPKIEPSVQQNPGGNQHGEMLLAHHSPSLNTILATMSCEAESRLSHDCIIEPTVKNPRTSFSNQPPTLTQLFDSGISSEKLNDGSIVSDRETSRTHVSISLPAHCSKLKQCGDVKRQDEEEISFKLRSELQQINSESTTGRLAEN